MDLEPIMQIERQEEVEVRQLDRLKQLSSIRILPMETAKRCMLILVILLLRLCERPKKMMRAQLCRLLI